MSSLLPSIPESFLNRSFSCGDSNVEITSLDIAPHGAFIVAGTSSGLVLLFDLSNPCDQRDGLLIGQIRARGMHTNLILTVKFSEDGRFVFAGVSKGSSEMLAIDLGRVLVDWDPQACVHPRRVGQDAIQQLQLKNLITFNYSDAKLRGFGAVVRLGENHSPSSLKSTLRSSARYRLACGRGIKNVHIWHFTAGYLQEDDMVAVTERQMHGKWEYVCDVASNGNTITHIEFRNGGSELLSKSAGMSLRLWELNATEVSTLENSTDCVEQVPCDGRPDDKIFNPSVTTASGFVLKPTYVDIVNSQDIKCLLPVGTVAYGGTYQFAVLNTGAPKEANRDVLELPERFSGDGVGGNGSGGAGPGGRGRRITREIENVICADGGQQALVMCADGGVVFYNASSRLACNGEDGSSGEEDAENVKGNGCGGALLELPALFRVKDLQQHPGSWTLRRIGRQGFVVILRAISSSSGLVSIESKLLSDFLPEGPHRSLHHTSEEETIDNRSLSYYVDATFHAEQREARQMWRRSNAIVAQTQKRVVNGDGKSARKTKSTSGGIEDTKGDEPVVQQSTNRKKKGTSVISTVSGDKSALVVSEGSSLVTPAAVQPSSSRHNKISPYEDATARLAALKDTRTPASPTVQNMQAYSQPPAPVARATSRGRHSTTTAANNSSSFAKLRALRDDDLVEDQPSEPILIGPPPKVRRLHLVDTVLPISAPSSTELQKRANCAVAAAVSSWLTSYGVSDDVVAGLRSYGSLGCCALQRVGAIINEQDRLRDQLVRDVSFALYSLVSSGKLGSTRMEHFSQSYCRLAAELVQRQQLELQGACAADAIVAKQTVPSHQVLAALRVRFRHYRLFEAADGLQAHVLAVLG